MTRAHRHPAVAADAAVAAGAAVDAAFATGILDRLRDGLAEPTAVAHALGLDRRLTARLLDALVALGVVTVDEDELSVDPSVPVALRARGRWAELAGALRGGPLPDHVDDPDGASAFYPALVGVLGDTFAAAAEEVARLLARPGLQVLDVGAGAAPWSLAIARREPTVRIVAVDLPGVVDVTRQAVADAGQADCVTVIAADVLAASMPADAGGPFDLVLVANVCHLFDASRVQQLLGGLAGALAPGGEVAVVDALPGGIREDPARALYALGLALRTSSGGLHGRQAYERWLRGAGLTPTGVHTTTDGLAVVRARAPAVRGTAAAGPRTK